MVNRRKERLESLIFSTVNSYFLNETDLLFSGVSISRVELTEDKRNLTVFWTTADTRLSARNRVSHEIKRHAGKIRSWLAKKIRSLQPPTVVFKFDDSVDVLSDVLKAELKLREVLQVNDDTESK